MVIHHSFKLLEQLSELERKIQQIESYLRESKLNIDSERILELLVKVRSESSSDRN
jgi:hypothetical protein